MAPCTLFDNSICPLRVLATCSGGLPALSQRKTSMGLDGPLKKGKGVFTSAFDFSANTRDALSHVTYIMFGRFYNQILNCNISA